MSMFADDALKTTSLTVSLTTMTRTLHVSAYLLARPNIYRSFTTLSYV